MKLTQRTIPFLFLSMASPSVLAQAIAVDDSATMIQGSGSISIDVLANDIANGVETDQLFITSYDINSTNYGSVVLDQETGELNYTPPDEDFVGTDTFQYFVVDDTGYGGPAIVTVEVQAQEPEPELPEEIAPNVTGARNKATASMLDLVCREEEVSEALLQSCNTLGNLSNGLDNTVAEIAPDEALIQRRLLAENSRNQMSRLYRSLQQMRSGGGGASVSVNDVTVPAGGAAAGDDMGSPWTTLSGLQVDNFERSSTQNETGYDYDAMGMMFGLGYRASSNLNVGAVVDWTRYDVEYINDGGDLESDVLSLNGFMSWYNGPLSIDVQAGYSMGSTDAQRRFTFPTTAFADSDYDSSQFHFSSLAEWSWRLNAWALRTFLRVDYINSEVDGFTETGDSLWLMASEKQDYEQVNTSIGFDASYTAAFSWGVMIPGLRVSAVSEDEINDAPVAFRLVDSNSPLASFELHADSPDDMYYQWDLNTVFVLQNGVSTFVSGQVISGYDNVDAVQFSAGVNWEF